jgi:predicted RND superfamily exporter protein
VSNTSSSPHAQANPTVPVRDDNVDRRRYLSRWLIGLVVLALLAIPSTIHSAAAIATLRNVPDQWLSPKLPLKQDFTEYIDRFGLADVMFISWPDARLGDDDVRKVTRLLREISEDGGPEGQVAEQDFSVSDQKRLAAEFFWKEAVKICDGQQPYVWVRSGTEIRDSLTRPPLSLSNKSATSRLRGTLIGPDRKQTCVLVSFSEASGPRQRALLPLMQNAIADELELPSEEIIFVGGAVDGAAVDNEAIASIEKYTLPSSILAAILCWLCLRSVPLTFTILSIATIGQGLALATVYYLGTPMNAILIVLPPLVFVLTVSSGIHLSNYYFDFYADSTMDQMTAIRQAMRVGVPPCLTATFTTVVGLMSLLLVRLEPVRTFGLIGSTSVLFTLAIMIFMLPGAMVLAKKNLRREKNVPRPDSYVGATTWLRPAWIMLLFSVLSGLAAVGFGQLRTSVSVPKMFQPDSELIKSYLWYEDQVSATMTAEVLLSFPVNPASGQRETIVQQHRQVLGVHSALTKLPEVGGALSAINFLPLPSKSRSLAATASRSAIRAEVADTDSQIHSLGYISQHEGERTWRVSLRLFQMSDTDFGSTIKRIRQTAKDAMQSASTLPAGELTMTGHVVIVDGTQQLLLNDLFVSFLTAFGVIGILMAVYLRSVVGGMLAMIPNLIPTLILFGSMGWLRSPLDIGSVMTASVALGIAVDDSVHLLSQYRLAKETVQDRFAAARSALRHCGWAMMQTTVVCSFSMLVYGLSPFVPTRRFAFFMLGLLVLAWTCVSVLLPAIMATRFGDYFVKSLNRNRNTNHG